MMVIYHIKDLMLKRSASIRRKITYEDVVQDTGLSKITLSRMSSKLGHRVNIDVIERLCTYFDCTPNDLMTIIPDPPKPEPEPEPEPPGGETDPAQGDEPLES
jgi:putative transcriptional regulator